MDLHKLLRRVEDLHAVDRVGETLAKPVRRVLRQRPGLSRALRGEWLGHPIHPIVVTVPIGAWVSAAVLDMAPGTRDAARRLVGLGLLATPPAVMLGLADYADLDVRQRRVGVAHAATNAVAAAFFLASYLGRSRACGLLGLSVLSVGGALGGHLAYAQGVGMHRWQPPELSEVVEHQTV